MINYYPADPFFILITNADLVSIVVQRLKAISCLVQGSTKEDSRKQGLVAESRLFARQALA